ncbi:ketopantoate reductase family protein [Pseudoclavibacter sp. 13-3]|uniref:ketopantoate reductase family protein n=1 Tax=Pseudoclavibacter sp. 13-3 TaxID=2901228 RepID=UPI001E40CA74|nr:2-dehydropantoate 2-reductase [Pseudoclavibacter sp. 13-3]MCD7101004.1 2-dehydropantoate 2-reductase [Pseudoclavibacter sp. 13-3]
MNDEVTRTQTPAPHRADEASPDATSPTRIAVIGCGSIGGAMAASLDRAGCQVTVTARGDHLAAMQRDGLRMTGAFGDHVAHVHAVPALDAAPDLAILTTKAQDAAAALADNAEWLRGVPLLVVQNGVEGPTTAHQAIAGASVLSGTSSIGANVPQPGLVDVTTPGPTVVCPGPGSDLDDARRVAALLQPALPARAVENTDGVLWTKLVVNQVNALPAITGLSIQQTVADDRLRRVLTASMREAVHVAHASGIRFGSAQGLDDSMLTVLAEVPSVTAEFIPLLLAKRMGDVPNTGSTLQSVVSGRPTEIDHLHGAVVRAAEQIGTRAPLNAVLVRLVHEVENAARSADGRPTFRSVDQVWAEAEDLL